MTSEAAEIRSPGRPRSARADLAILEAAIECFITDGFRGMSMDGVAARAVVGKATIYRRWNSKEELVVDAIASLKEDLPDFDTGTVRTDVIALTRYIVSSGRHSKVGRCMFRMFGELQANPDLGRIYLERVLEPRRETGRKILRRGIERGELRADIDLDVAVDLFMGPMILRRMVGGMDEDAAEDYIARLADHALDGLSTSA
jgi:AcrR family transcriptional regulator